MRDSQRTIQAILDAAERVILKHGVAKTTLDEVAHEASVSKGGLLHHFPNKEAILIGVVRALISRFEADIQAHKDQDPDPKGAFTRAFLRATLSPNPSCVEAFLAFSAAFSYMPALLELHRESNARWQRQVEKDGIDPVTAAIVRLAADGLWMARIHQIDVPSKKVRTVLIDSLLAMTRGDDFRLPMKRQSPRKPPRLQQSGHSGSR